MNLSKIDALVAEHVMGWVNNWDDPTKPGMWGIMDWMVDEAGVRTPIRVSDFPCYSDDIAEAWEVLKAVQQRGLMFAIYCCGTGLVTVRPHQWTSEWGTKDVEHLQGQAMSAPLAICLAALKAKGIDIDALGEDA